MPTQTRPMPFRSPGDTDDTDEDENMNDMPEMGETPPAPIIPPRHEVCLPVSALAMPDESEAMNAPAVGDAVQFNCEGKVSRIEGENAYVTLSAVNGQDMPETEEPGEPSEQDQMAALETEARNQPDRYA